jgi:hypothetical protein
MILEPVRYAAAYMVALLTDAVANYLNTPTSVANPNVDRGDSDIAIRNPFTTGVTYNLAASIRCIRSAAGGRSSWRRYFSFEIGSVLGLRPE